MKSVLVGLAVLSLGCGDLMGAPPAEEKKVVAAPVAPKPVEKKLMTITTKSPEAKAAFLSGWELADNGRNAESLESCKKAISLDPDFALAHTCVGNQLPGAAAQAEYDKGVSLAAKLPEAERLTVEAFAALRREESAKYYADIERVATLAPDDFHAQVMLGNAVSDRRDFAGSEAAFKKALALNPGASFVNGALTWVYTQERKYDDALASAKKYAEGAPAEAGAHQALAAAMLNLNQTKEAEGELEKAVAAGPKVRFAFYDLATVKAIAGDGAGARDVLEKSKATETLPTDAADRANNTAWVLFGEGKQADALALLASSEKDFDAKKLPWPGYEATTRAQAFWALGKAADSLKAAEAGLARCDSRPESSAAYKAGCHRDLLTAKGWAQVSLGKLADAQKTVAELQELAKKVPDNHWFGLGVEMLADQVSGLEKKDAKSAAALYAKCPPDDFWWKLSILRQAEKAGDKSLVEQVRKDLLGRPIKDFGYPLIASEAKK